MAISQLEQQEYFIINEQRLSLQRELDKLQKIVDAKRQDILTRANNGEIFSKGKYKGEIVDGRKSVSWRDIFEKYVSHEEAEKILSSTIPSKTIKITLLE